jgi:hypothetical protein
MEFNLETYLQFIDSDKAFDNIERQILFTILLFRHISDTLLKAIVEYLHTKKNIDKIQQKKLSKPV